MNRGTGGNANSTNRGTTGNANANLGASNPNAKGGAAGGNATHVQGNKAGGASQVGNRGNAAGNAGNKGEAGAAGNHHQPAGSRTVALKNGGSATYRKNGQVRTIQTHGMTINHGMNGQRRVVAMHNGRQVVAYGHNGGYSQRAYYRHGGREYVQRTYWRGGHAYAYGYRSYYWGGHPYYGYAPGYYYGPAYYGWAYNPWPAPVYYNWGWGGAPWYGYYGVYYQPYPVYPFAALWLADYLIAANLQAAYAAQAEAEQGQLVQPQFQQESSDVIASLWSSDPLVAASLASAYGSSSRSYLMAAAGAPSSGATAMPADVKQAIADEMKNEIAAEKDAAANKDKDSTATGDQLPSALDPKIRYFVVSVDEDLTAADGTECALTPGDVVYRKGDKPDEDNMVDATVKSAKKSECPVGVAVAIDVTDLQDMHNSLRQTMDEGLKKLADNNGKNGLPAAPDTKTTTGEVPPPAPDSNVKDDLDKTQKDADQAEAEARQSN
jgi:hypothetical protein